MIELKKISCTRKGLPKGRLVDEDLELLRDVLNLKADVLFSKKMTRCCKFVELEIKIEGEVCSSKDR